MFRRKKITVCYLYITKERDHLGKNSFSSYVITKETSIMSIATEYTEDSEQLPYSVKEHTYEYLEKKYGRIIDITQKEIKKADSGIGDLFEKYEIILRK